MELYGFLLVLLLLCRMAGEIAHRLGEPTLSGELLAGVCIGFALPWAGEILPALVDIQSDPSFITLTNMGMFFLVLYGGVEMRTQALVKVSGKAVIVAVCGMLLPILLGFALTGYFLPESELKTAQCLIMGAALAITGVPVSIRIFQQLGLLESRAGQTVVVAAIIDDMLSLVLLAFVTGVISNGGWPDWSDLVHLLVNVATFLAIVMLSGRFVVPHMAALIHSLRAEELEFSSLIIAGLALALVAEFLGLHFILGAFAAGLLFDRKNAGEETYIEVKKRLSGVTQGLLGPIFFASIGMHLDLSALIQVPLYLTLLILVAVTSKLVGAGLPAYLVGYTTRESVIIGVGMNARGAVELILANIALTAGLFAMPQPVPTIVASLFSCIVLVAVLTTLITPFLLKRCLSHALDSEKSSASHDR